MKTYTFKHNGAEYVNYSVESLRKLGWDESLIQDVILSDQKAQERAWRTAEINTIEWLRDRHRDEVEFGKETTLTIKHYQALMDYIEALREWPAAPKFPDSAHRPQRPEWMK